MEPREDQVMVVVTVEIRSGDPARMGFRVSKTERYEIPLPMERVPLKLQLLKGEKELVHEIVMDD